MAAFGTIAHLGRYPVKSMAGEVLDEVSLGLDGFPGDRWYAFVKDGDFSAFPWLTARDVPDLVRFRPVIRAFGRKLELDVISPESTTFDITSDALRDELALRAGRPVRLHSNHRGNYDAASLSLILRSTVGALTEDAGVAPDHRRFRMNLVIESDLPPFAEPRYLGRVLRCGDARFAITKQDQRCEMITLDPDSAERTPAVLKEAGIRNNACAGVYLTVLTPGVLRAGDEVTLDD